MKYFVLALLLGLGVSLGACSSKQESPVGTQRSEPAEPPSGFLESPRINDDWIKEDVTDAQRARDIESCYYSARAMTAHDQRIESDIDAGRSASSQITQTREFTSSLNRYEERNREIRLFNECMRAKGYAPTVQDTQ